MSDWKKKLQERIQADFPLTPNPYAELAGEYSVTEEEILLAISELKNSGIIRRIGASINSRKAGYVSTLVACKVSAVKLESVAAEIGRNPGVTHSYERENDYNLWFTLISRNSEILQKTLDEYSNLDGIVDLNSLPASKVYKLKVRFGV